MNAEEFDLEALAELREDLGSETFSFLIGKCAQDVRERLDKLGLAAPARDMAQIRALAHQLKGLFLQFSADATMRDATALESGAAETIDASVAHLRASATRALAFFESQQEGST
jgi:hypothetical protein